MPKPLAKSFSDIFRFSWSAASAPLSKTAFTGDEIQRIKEIFENPDNNYEKAYREFVAIVEGKEGNSRGSLANDPFFQAIARAYKGVSIDNQGQTNDDLFSSLRENEEMEAEKADSSKYPVNPISATQAPQAEGYQLNKQIGLKRFFFILLDEFHKASPEDNAIWQTGKEKKEKLSKWLSSCINTNSHEDILSCLAKMLSALYERKVTDNLTAKSPEYKLILELLTVFMLCDQPTSSEFSKLITTLTTLSSTEGEKIPPDENIILDLFTLRLKTLNKQEEIAECKQLFNTIVTTHHFGPRIPREVTQVLLTSQQFFKEFSLVKEFFYEDKYEEVFNVYQAFLTNLADHIKFYRELPIEQNARIVNDLLGIAIQRLLEINQAYYMIYAGEVLCDENVCISIYEPIRRFLIFLSNTYGKSSLIPKTVFEIAINRILLSQAKLLPKARDIDEEILLHQRFSLIYGDYKSISLKFSIDSQSFLNELFSIARDRLFSNANLKEQRTVLYALLEGINPWNYDFIKRAITFLSQYNRDHALKTLFQFFKENPHFTPSQLNLRSELRDEKHAENSFFLREIAPLHGDYENLWATLKWSQISKNDALYHLVINKKIKSALAGFLRAAVKEDYGFNSETEGAELIQGGWLTFTHHLAWLFLMLHDPSDSADTPLIRELEQKIRSFYVLSRELFPAKFPHRNVWRLVESTSFRLLTCLGKLVNEYQIPCNRKEVEKFLADFAASIFEPLAALHALAPLFSQNKTLFDALISVFYRQEGKFDYIQTLEPNEVNKKLVESVVNLELSEREEKKKQPKSRICHEEFQNVIVLAYNALNQQQSEISEKLLENYFSLCEPSPDDDYKKREGSLDYANFVSFLFIKLPVRKHLDSDKSRFNYLAKVVEKCLSVREYTRAVMYLNPIPEMREFCLFSLRIAVKKFSHSVECFWLLDKIEYMFGDYTSNKYMFADPDSDKGLEIKAIYSSIAESYLANLQAEFQNLAVSKASQVQSKTIGGNLALEGEALGQLIAEEKKAIDLAIKENKSELIQLASIDTLYEWYKKFREYSKQVKKFEQDVGQSLEALPAKIAKNTGTLSTKIKDYHRGALDRIEKLFQKLETLAQKKEKTYKFLEVFRKEAKKEIPFASELTNYFIDVDSCFIGLNFLMGQSQKKLMQLYSSAKVSASEQFAEKFTNTTLRQLEGKSLIEQIRVIEQLEKDFNQSKKTIDESVNQIFVLLFKTSDELAVQNQKIMQKFVERLNQVDQRILEIGQTIVSKEKEKSSLEESISVAKARRVSCQNEIKSLADRVQADQAELQGNQESLNVFFSNKVTSFSKTLETQCQTLGRECQEPAKKMSLLFETIKKSYQKEIGNHKNSLLFRLAKWIFEDRGWLIPAWIQAWADAYVHRINVTLPGKIAVLEQALKVITPLLFLDGKSLGDYETLLDGISMHSNNLSCLINELQQSEKIPIRFDLDSIMRLQNKMNALIENITAYEKMQAAYDQKSQAYDQRIKDIHQKIATLNTELQSIDGALSNQETQLTLTTQTLAALKSELAALNSEKEQLAKPYKALSDDTHQSKYSPLTTILYDESLLDATEREKQKIRQLTAIVAQKKIENYQVGVGFINKDGIVEELFAGPIYHAVVKGTPEMLKIILGGIEGFTSVEKSCLLSDTAGIFQGMTPLHLAIALGDLEKVKLLVEAGCDLNKMGIVKEAEAANENDVKMPPLLWAYDLNKIEIVNYLIAPGKHPVSAKLMLGADINGIDSFGDTLLHMAVKRCDLKTIIQLVTYSHLEVDSKNARNETPLFCAVQLSTIPDGSRYEMIRELVRTGETQTTESLLDQRQPFDSCHRDKNGFTFLYRAILEKNLPLVIWLTRQRIYRQMLNTKNARDDMPLQTAARIGNLAIFKELWYLEIKGFDTDVNQVNKNGMSALSAALTHYPATQAIVDFILNNEKLDVEKLKRNHGHIYVLYPTCLFANNLYLAALIHQGFDPNCTDRHGYTFLHHVAYFGNFNAMKFLFESKKLASIHPRDKRNYTPLMLAYTSEKVDQKTKSELAYYLIEKTENMNDLLGRCDSEGNNLLHLAVKADDFRLVRQLLEKLSILESGEKTPFTGARFFASAINHLSSLLDDKKPLLDEKNRREDIPFHLATSVEMVRFFVDYSLVDIQNEYPKLIEKLKMNSAISDDEKSKILDFICEKVPGTTPRKLMPSLFEQGATVFSEKQKSLISTTKDVCWFRLTRQDDSENIHRLDSLNGSLNFICGMAVNRSWSIEQHILLQCCETYIKALLATLKSQSKNTPDKIETLISGILKFAETHNRQLNRLLDETFVVGAYDDLVKQGISTKLLVDESALEGDALAKARTENTVVHIGYMIEAFKLGGLTTLPEKANQAPLLEYARSQYEQNQVEQGADAETKANEAQRNRALYIDVVEIFLEKLHIQSPRRVAVYASKAVVALPSPLQVPTNTAAPYQQLTTSSSSSAESPVFS